MIREYEEELVWANFGVRVADIHHLRLGFYKGDIFTENPEINRDVLPVLEQLKAIKPTVISVAFDPEGAVQILTIKFCKRLQKQYAYGVKLKDLSNYVFGDIVMSGTGLIYMKQIS